MRIPFPTRIPLWRAVTFAFGLAILQVLAGTNPLFSILCVLFITVSTVAFNVAGGLSRPSGSYVFFFATLVVIVGLVVKVVSWEPADSHLRVPILTMSIYVVAMLGMLLSVYLSRRFSRKQGLLRNVVSTDNMIWAAAGCAIAGMGFPFLGIVLGSSSGPNVFTPLISAFSQFNNLLPLAVILGTTAEIRRSGGTRSVNLPVLLGSAAMFFQGALLGFSKQALFEPPLCWVAACAAMRYRLSRFQIIGGLIVFVLMNRYMVPYSQIGRNYRSDTNTFAQNVALSVDLLGRLGELREKWAEESAGQDRTTGYEYFDTPKGIFDRLEMISMDDGLNENTETEGAYGLQPVAFEFLNFIPRVFWKDKPTLQLGNLFAHRLGILAEDDTSTGISFSPVGEAYHEGRWIGVILVAPFIWTLLFLVTDSLCGDVRESPWGILVLAQFAHFAPEGMLGGATYMMSFGAFGIVVVALISRYLLPLIGVILSGSKQKAAPVSARPKAHAGRFPASSPPSGSAV